jgi:hypothetical protein
VTVNGFVALVDSGQFAVEVPVDETVTSLAAVARDATGNTLGSQTIPVTVQIPAEWPVLLSRVSPIIGPAPLTVRFELRCLDPISRIDLDADGNGTVDFQGTTLDNQHQRGVRAISGDGYQHGNNTYTKTAFLSWWSVS